MVDQRTKIKSGHGGSRDYAGRNPGSWDPDVQRQLFAVSLLEERGLSHADAIDEVAPTPEEHFLGDRKQPLRAAWRRWRDGEFLAERRVMTEADGAAYVVELRRRAPVVVPCSCSQDPRPHVHCVECGVALAPFPGPVLLDGRALGPVCPRDECYSGALRRAAPDVHLGAAELRRLRRQRADKFKGAREALGLSVADLAKKANTGIDVIAFIETGSAVGPAAMPGFSVAVARIAEVLGVNAVDDAGVE